MWASRCQVCGEWPSQVVCHDCLARFLPPSERCGRCALPCPAGTTVCGTCLTAPPALTWCLVAVDYAFPWATLVHRFKFRGEPGWARHFAGLMRALPGAAALLSTHTVVPVPLTRERLGQRGFNQAWELAKALKPSHAVPDALLKLADQTDQHRLTRDQRLRNAVRAFAPNPARQAAITGRRVLLVDDVMTTGATLNAAAEVLRRAGATEVSALAFARTLP